jgi:NAD(P)-dependent dehydrogenase (short-subunit alcohol dehydrogenase family)
MDEADPHTRLRRYSSPTRCRRPGAPRHSPPPPSRSEARIPRLTTPFGFHSTAAEVAAGIDLTGATAVVTGAASGIGVETARALVATGAAVTLAVRDPSAGRRVAADIRATTGSDRVRVTRLDLAEPGSITAFVAAWRGPLHLLVNNAGVMALPEQHTVEGWEMQFAINHLGHFLLTTGLRRALAADGRARVVSVSSSAHQISPVIFDDIHFRRRPYDPLSAYGQSKTANVLFAVAASARWMNDGITVNALMPGAIATNLQRHLGGMKTPPELRKTPAEGAATSVLLATSPLLEGIGGRYFADCNEAVPLREGERDMAGVAPYALDPAAAEILWQESLRLTGMRP